MANPKRMTRYWKLLDGKWVQVTEKNTIKTKPGKRSILATNLRTGKMFTIPTYHQIDEYGFSKGEVTKVCNGLKESSKGHTFKYIPYIEEETDEN